MDGGDTTSGNNAHKDGTDYTANKDAYTCRSDSRKHLAGFDDAHDTPTNLIDYGKDADKLGGPKAKEIATDDLQEISTRS